jgi:hypothetical protein
MSFRAFMVCSETWIEELGSFPALLGRHAMIADFKATGVDRAGHCVANTHSR